MDDLVSIIIPVYNTEKTAIALVKNLLAGSYKKIEIICIDDGSRDESFKQLSELAKKEARLVVVRQKNQGAAEARNRGLELAQGKFISFIDSDDIVQHNFIEKLLRKMQKSDAILALCQIRQRLLRSNKEVIQYKSMMRKRGKTSFRSYILRLMLEDGRMYPVVNKLFRAEIIRVNKIKFDKKRVFAEDTQFVLQYLNAAGEGEIAFVKEPLYIYNFGTETSTVIQSALDWQNWQKNLEDVKNFAEGDRAAKKLIWRLFLRWRISHGLAVARAPISKKQRREKLGRVGAAVFGVLVKLRH